MEWHRPNWIVTVDFHDKDSVAVVTEAVTKAEAEDKALDAFLEDGVEETFAVTVSDFESDNGAYTEGMFTRI